MKVKPAAVFVWTTAAVCRLPRRVALGELPYGSNSRTAVAPSAARTQSTALAVSSGPPRSLTGPFARRAITPMLLLDQTTT